MERILVEIAEQDTYLPMEPKQNAQSYSQLISSYVLAKTLDRTFHWLTWPYDPALGNATTSVGSIRVNTDRGINTDRELQTPIRRLPYGVTAKGSFLL